MASDLMTIAITGVLGTSVGGGGVWAWLSTRAKAKIDAVPALVNAAATFQEALNRAAEQLQASLGKRIEHLEQQNVALEARCAKAEAGHEGCTAELAELKAWVEAKMREPLNATYVLPPMAQPGVLTSPEAP